MLNDVWALSLQGSPAWVQITPGGTPPAGRSGHTAIYDAGRDRIIVFGGRSSSEALNEVWALILWPSPTWSKLSPALTPPRRCGHTAVYDPTHFRMIAFGGWDGEFVMRNDVWTLQWDPPPPLAVEPDAARPIVLGAYPNPFRSGGRIQFELSRASAVMLEVFDVRGRRVETLARGAYSAGRHEVAWNTRTLSPGVYFVSLTSEAGVDRRRVALIR
jgi:hypothetical protein